MKSAHFLLFLSSLFCFIIISGCSEISYQVIETNISTDNISVNNKIEVNYNLWENGGVFDITISNTGDEPVFIDWLQSSFCLNGISTVLFTPINKTTSATVLSSQGNDLYGREQKRGLSNSISIGNNRIEIIPPHMSIRHVFFSNGLSGQLVDCSLGLGKHDSKSLNYDENNTPFMFNVSIAVLNDILDSTPIFVYDSFYADKVNVLSSQEFKGETKKIEDCNGEVKYVNTYPYFSTSNYYFKSGNDKGKSSGGGYIILGAILIGVITVGALAGN